MHSRCIQVKAMVVYWTAFGNINYTHLNLAPTFYMEKFGCTPLQFGNYLAIVNSTNIPLTFVSGAIETILLNRGVRTITIRRASTIVGSVGMAAASALYGFSQSPGVASETIPSLLSRFTCWCAVSRVKRVAISCLVRALHALPQGGGRRHRPELPGARRAGHRHPQLRRKRTRQHPRELTAVCI